MTDFEHHSKKMADTASALAKSGIVTDRVLADKLIRTAGKVGVVQPLFPLRACPHIFTSTLSRPHSSTVHTLTPHAFTPYLYLYPHTLTPSLNPHSPPSHPHSSKLSTLIPSLLHILHPHSIHALHPHTLTHPQVKALGPQVVHASKMAYANPDNEVRV